jgi:hypothetical protein
MMIVMMYTFLNDILWLGVGCVGGCRHDETVFYYIHSTSTVLVGYYYSQLVLLLRTALSYSY